MKILIFTLTYFVLGDGKGHGECAAVDLGVRGEYKGVSLFFLPDEVQGWDSAPQAWQQVPLAPGAS